MPTTNGLHSYFIDIPEVPTATLDNIFREIELLQDDELVNPLHAKEIYEHLNL